MKQLICLFLLVSATLSCTTKVQPRPVADFDMAPDASKPGVIQFTNKSTNAERYQWVFSDGQATTTESPIIVFKSNGIYTATLTARSGTNNDEVTKSVEVSGIVTTGNVFFWTNNGGYTDIELYVDNTLKGLITQAQSSTPTCGADGSITLSYPAGTYNFYAKSKAKNWSGSFTIKNGECVGKLLQ